MRVNAGDPNRKMELGHRADDSSCSMMIKQPCDIAGDPLINDCGGMANIENGIKAV